MTITEQFKAKRCVFSIECFPPKQTNQMDKLKDTLRQMQALNPGFISVTFGAGGSAGGVSTVEVADYLQNELSVPTMAAASNAVSACTCRCRLDRTAGGDGFPPSGFLPTRT